MKYKKANENWHVNELGMLKLSGVKAKWMKGKEAYIFRAQHFKSGASDQKKVCRGGMEVEDKCSK